MVADNYQKITDSTGKATGGGGEAKLRPAALSIA
jgi:hypothetical protein